MFRHFGGGTILDQIWVEGLHVIPPWDHLSIYETRIQERMLTRALLSKDGLELKLKVSVRFHPIIEELGLLHQEIGPDYFDRFIAPASTAHLRRIIGDRTAFELYSTERNLLQEASALDLKRGHIQLEQLLIVEIELPPIVREAIEQKHRQEQLLLEYTFRLEREEKEAERKRTEAAGLRDFNSIAQTIGPALLRWRAIDATLELARSPNAKVVIIGGGEDKLPIILDTSDSAGVSTGQGLNEAAPVAPNAAPPP